MAITIAMEIASRLTIDRRTTTAMSTLITLVADSMAAERVFISAVVGESEVPSPEVDCCVYVCYHVIF